ncbi:MAG: phage recombination protein Bet [Candidatus Marinimicrobia bacterium]|nr:phage recombination protein Bet [Candidatus Neomarinimicrobiota bacterium]
MVKKSVWDDNMEAIRQTFGKDLTTTEFTMFVEMGKSLKLNPFNREIWCVKYGNQPPSIFVGRDGYRKNAQAQPDYNGHIKEAIYENDEFEIENGRVIHKINFKDRGRLIGAYCEVYRKGIDHPFRESVKFSEYNTGFSNWKKMPETMIKKVAEAQALRMAYQSVFAGTYDESERWEANGQSVPQEPQRPRTQKKPTQPTIDPSKAVDGEITGPEPKEKIKEQPNKPTNTKPVMDKKTKDFLSAMQIIKSEIKEVTGSAELYYSILGLNGYEHANQIHDKKTMEEVYKELRQALRDRMPRNHNNPGGDGNA